MTTSSTVSYGIGLQNSSFIIENSVIGGMCLDPRNQVKIIMVRMLLG